MNNFRKISIVLFFLLQVYCGTIIWLHKLKLIVLTWFWISPVLVEEILTTTGATVLVADGVRFYKHSMRGAKTHWYCGKKTRGKCRASITTISDLVIKAFLQHNHDKGWADNDDILQKRIMKYFAYEWIWPQNRKRSSHLSLVFW